VADMKSDLLLVLNRPVCSCSCLGSADIYFPSSAVV